MSAEVFSNFVEDGKARILVKDYKNEFLNMLVACLFFVLGFQI